MTTRWLPVTGGVVFELQIKPAQLPLNQHYNVVILTYLLHKFKDIDVGRSANSNKTSQKVEGQDYTQTK